LVRVHGLEPVVVGILTGRHGSVQRSGGIDLRKALRRSKAGLSRESCGRPIRGSSVDIIRNTRADVVVEVTPLRLTPRQIALDHMVAALSSGKHVITANKGPVVYHYRKLRDLARSRGVGFRYEGTVMDGAPVFNLFQETLRGIRILSFEGILNSTTNLILSMIEEGRTYDEGVDAADLMGLLETDPAMDLEGWDATVKACLLANVLMGGRLRPERVPREGIASLTRARIDRARASHRRLKLIARGWRDGSAVKASVSLKSIGPEHPLFQVRGTSSSLLVRTDMLKDLQIIERDPGVRQTAYALYSDLLAIHEGRLSP
jgi:homoserine dehydrogenase